MQLNHPLNLSTDFYNNNVHEIARWMRAEAPIYKARLTRWKPVYLINRYADVEATLKDPRFVKNTKNIQGKNSWGGGFWAPACEPAHEYALRSPEENPAP